MSTNFALLNRGKDTVELDLKQEEDRERLRSLVSSADVIIEQFRPGVMDRLGFGYDDVRALNPAIVYCSITGYGQDGPDAQLAGHDINYLARSGLLALTAGAEDLPAFPPAPLADIVGGAYPAVMNIALALLRRERTGEGVHLDISMTDNLFPLAYWALGLLEVSGMDPAPGSELLNGGSARYGFYRTADGRFLAVAAVEEKFWTAFCDALQLNERDRDDRTNPELTRLAVASRIATKTADEWQERLAGVDACCEVVRSLSEACCSPHFIGRGLFDRRVSTRHGHMTALPVPVVAALRRPELTLPAPDRTDRTRSSLAEAALPGPAGGRQSSTDPNVGRAPVNRPECVLRRTTMRIALGDVDGARLVYFAAPFGWSERLFSAWMAEEVRPFSDLFTAGIAMPVVSTRSTFHAPLHQDEVVELILKTQCIGRTSFTVRTEVRRSDGSVALVVETSHVHVADLDGAVTPSVLPDWLRSPLERGLEAQNGATP
jgi:crotonobetainyl-CoA:carnitine CoA-transferase CaiB-like acyl-CoA transferase/acyl-CoA thioesterase FadM